MQGRTYVRILTSFSHISYSLVLLILISFANSPCIFAQGMGSGTMATGGRGMRGNQNPQQTPDQTTPPQKHQNPFGIDSTPAEGVEARTSALENFIFGGEQKKLPLEKRIARLEKKLIPYEHHKAGEDLNQRVDHLWTILSSANKPSEKSPTQ